MLNFKVLQMTLSLLGRWNRLARPVESTILTFWNHNDFLMNKSRYWFYFLEGWPNKNPFRPHCIALYKESDYFLAELEAKTWSIKRPCITDCIVDPPPPPPPSNFQTFRRVWIDQPAEMSGDLSKTAIGVTVISLNLVPNQTVLIHNGVGLGFSMATTFTSSLVLSSLSAFGVAT